ncbi:MAG: TIGR03668 family PPOX class F420-dependent oxidoreductase [Steroidobacteraceae bacterium]
MATLNTRELAFVQTARIGHLGTADGAGEPHVVPVCYAILAGAAHILIDRKPKRFDDPHKLKRVANIAAHPRACLTVDRYDEDWSRLAFVMMRGAAMLVDEGEEYEAAVRSLQLRYPQYREQRLEGRPVIALRIETVTSWGVL